MRMRAAHQTTRMDSHGMTGRMEPLLRCTPHEVCALLDHRQLCRRGCRLALHLQQGLVQHEEPELRRRGVAEVRALQAGSVVSASSTGEVAPTCCATFLAADAVPGAWCTSTCKQQ